MDVNSLHAQRTPRSDRISARRIVVRTACVCTALSLILGANCEPAETMSGGNGGFVAEPDDVSFTACGSIATSCFDPLAEEPVDAICFRPQTRWERRQLSWTVVSPLSEDVISGQRQRDIMIAVFNAWSSAGSLSFRETAGPADITISFDTGDPFPFDGGDGDDDGNVLGYAFFPGTARAGEVHLCQDEDWTISANGNGVDLFRVVAHEVGHALGLEHSTDPQDIMYYAFSPTGPDMLSGGDIDALARIYGTSADAPLPEIMQEECPPDVGNLFAPNAPDADLDGIPDAVEVFILGTDPLSADSDGDGLDDFAEVFEGLGDPLIGGPDSDGDGLGDEEEAAIGTDPMDPDSDGDGLSDFFELVTGSNPTNPDTDEDGCRDAIDFFPLQFAPDMQDCQPDVCMTDTECQDGLFCNGVEVCANGQCFPGPPPCIPANCAESSGTCSCQGDTECDDSNPCTVPLCVNGVCEFQPNDMMPCDDFNPCTVNDQCIDGMCTSSSFFPCPPGSSCNPTNGMCE